MARNGYSDDICIVCGKQLTKGHKTPYCHQHLIEYKRKEKIQHWLLTGEVGMTVDTTIRGPIRDYILKEQDNCCAICGIGTTWNGQELHFVLDHINGDASNSKRENLRLICPNCDSQLGTYKSRNKNSARNSRKNFLKNTTNKEKI